MRSPTVHSLEVGTSFGALHRFFRSEWLSDPTHWTTLSRRYGFEIPLTGIVLDAGCGRGLYTQHLVEQTRKGRVLALDVSSQSLRLLRQIVPGASCLQASVEHLPLSDGSAHVILMEGVLNHVPDPLRALGECYRVLRPGGMLYVGFRGWGGAGHEHGASPAPRDGPMVRGDDPRVGRADAVGTDDPSEPSRQCPRGTHHPDHETHSITCGPRQARTARRGLD